LGSNPFLNEDVKLENGVSIFLALCICFFYNVLSVFCNFFNIL